jgi:hypothetical protein
MTARIFGHDVPNFLGYAIRSKAKLSGDDKRA